MKLAELLENRVATALGDTEITALTDDNRRITEGCLFACIKGERFDGHNAAAAALEQGEPLLWLSVILVWVPGRSSWRTAVPSMASFAQHGSAIRNAGCASSA